MRKHEAEPGQDRENKTSFGWKVAAGTVAVFLVVGIANQGDAGSSRGTEWEQQPGISAEPAPESQSPKMPLDLEQTAAQAHGWGEPIPEASDEFNYDGTPNSDKWKVYGLGGDSDCWEGHDGNGQRCADANHVNGEFLRQTGETNGDTAGIASAFGQYGGRWEVRARSMAAPGSEGNTYHPVLITWPDSNEWPEGAEYDFLENSKPGDQCASAFLHYPNHQPKRQEHAEKCEVDLSEWHNFGFEWLPDEQVLVGYLDGEEWYRFEGEVANAPGPMHLTIQLDNFHGDGMQEAYFDTDWVRTYALPGERDNSSENEGNN